MSRVPQVVAFGGGGFSMESGNALLDDYVLAATGVERPKVCFLPTASGDADHYIVRFYRHFPAVRCEPSHVSLFRRDCGAPDPRHAPARAGPDLRRRRLRALAARACGARTGSTTCCARRGSAAWCMCGLSAGSLCWFEEGLTAFHGEQALPVAGARASCRAPTPCTTTRSRGGARTFHAAIAAGMAPRLRAPTTAPRCTSSATDSHRVVSSRPRRAAPTASSAVGGEVGRVAAGDASTWGRRSWPLAA